MTTQWLGIKRAISKALHPSQLVGHGCHDMERGVGLAGLATAPLRAPLNVRVVLIVLLVALQRFYARPYVFALLQKVRM
jgi:hypothetical protein